MFELDMGGVVVKDLAGFKRAERKENKIYLVFEGQNGNDVFVNASAMREDAVWNATNSQMEG
jgi:hypothetical protein